MRRPRILDLFCGQGGASMGYYLAGFDVIGMDIKPQREYPFAFIRGHALKALQNDRLLSEFDAIHASPPCQSETVLKYATRRDYEDYLTPTLELLDDLLDIPWVVENTEFTRKMPGSVMLCGTHFNLGYGGRVLRRHRRFAASFKLPRTGACWCAGKPTGGVYGHLPSHGQRNQLRFNPTEAKIAMGIDWMSKKGLTQAIPPDYTRWVGEHLLRELHMTAYARDHLRERFCSGRIEQFAKL